MAIPCIQKANTLCLPRAPHKAPVAPKSLAPNLDFLLFSLDNCELDRAIAEQENTIKSAGAGASTYMKVALAAYHAERNRRMDSCTAPPVTATSTTGIVNDLGDSDSSSETTADKDAEGALLVPLAPPALKEPRRAAGHRGAQKRVRFVEDAGPRPVRIRFTPVRYGERAPETGSSRKRKYESPALQEQYEANQVTRKQLLGNKTLIEDTAAYFGCALTAQKPRTVSVTPNGKKHDTKTACPWLGAQAQKLAVADDGYYYDFRHITQYIRDNVHKQLRSPRTGAAMSSQVYYVGKCKTTKKPKTMVWTPEIFVREELAEPDSDAEAGPSAAPAECVAVD